MRASCDVLSFPDSTQCERSALLPNRSFLYKTIKNTSVFVTVGGGGGDGERRGGGGGGELRQTDKSKRLQLKDSSPHN